MFVLVPRWDQAYKIVRASKDALEQLNIGKSILSRMILTEICVEKFRKM